MMKNYKNTEYLFFIKKKKKYIDRIILITKSIKLSKLGENICKEYISKNIKKLLILTRRLPIMNVYNNEKKKK